MASNLKDLRRSMSKPRGGSDSNTPLPRTSTYLRNNMRKVKDVRIILQPKNLAVTFIGRVSGENDTYLTKVKFVDLDPNDLSDTNKKGFRKAKTVNNKDIFFHPPNINQQEVLLSCTCEDFRFNWEFPTFGKDTLLRKSAGTSKRALEPANQFTKYKRKTPPKRRSRTETNPNPDGHDFKNPKSVMGFCKHVFSLVKYLEKKDFVSGSL